MGSDNNIKPKAVNGLNPNGRFKALNDIYETWKEVKRGLKSNTFEGYKYAYEMYVRNSIGKKKIPDGLHNIFYTKNNLRGKMNRTCC